MSEKDTLGTILMVPKEDQNMAEQDAAPITICQLMRIAQPALRREIFTLRRGAITKHYFSRLG